MYRLGHVGHFAEVGKRFPGRLYSQKSTQTSFSHGFSILFTKFRWGLNFREGVRGVMSSAEVEGSPQAMPYRLFLTLSLIVHSKVNDQLRHEV